MGFQERLLLMVGLAIVGGSAAAQNYYLDDYEFRWTAESFGEIEVQVELKPDSEAIIVYAGKSMLRDSMRMSSAQAVELAAALGSVKAMIESISAGERGKPIQAGKLRVQVSRRDTGEPLIFVSRGNFSSSKLLLGAKDASRVARTLSKGTEMVAFARNSVQITQ